MEHTSDLPPPARLLPGGVLQLFAGLLEVRLPLLGTTFGLGIRISSRLARGSLDLALGGLGGVPGLVSLAHHSNLLPPAAVAARSAGPALASPAVTAQTTRSPQGNGFAPDAPGE